jgi:hypothetical protein
VKKLSKKSIRLLRQVKRAILAEPELYDQQSLPRYSCNAPCCLLGWVVWLNDPKKFEEMLVKDSEEYEWDRLLGSGGSWPHEHKKALYAAETDVERAAVAASRIEHFIAANGAE